MARGSICVQRDGKTYRLAWFNDSKAGIYYGILGSDRDHHLSYHRDGQRHNKAGDERYGHTTDTPIEAHRGVRQLSSGTVWLTSQWLNERTEYDPAKEEIAIVVSGDSQENEQLYFSVDWCLIELGANGARRDMPKHLAAMRPDGALREYREIPLDNFPGHAIGIAVSVWPKT